MRMVLNFVIDDIVHRMVPRHQYAVRPNDRIPDRFSMSGKNVLRKQLAIDLHVSSFLKFLDLNLRGARNTNQGDIGQRSGCEQKSISHVRLSHERFPGGLVFVDECTLATSQLQQRMLPFSQGNGNRLTALAMRLKNAADHFNR